MTSSHCSVGSQDQDRRISVSSGLETMTAVSRTTPASSDRHGINTHDQCDITPFDICTKRLLCPPPAALNDTAIRPPVCPSLGYRNAGCVAQLPRLYARWLPGRPPEICGLRTRPQTDVDPLPVELPSAGGGGISSRRPRGDNLFINR